MPVTALPSDWSALSSSAALAVMAPRVAGGVLSDEARLRIVWELEKYAPAYVERTGAEILARAEPFVNAQLGNRSDPAELLAVGLQHGSRVVSARGRRGHEHAIAMAARAAMSSNALYDPTAEWLLQVRLRSKGMAAVDGPFGTIEMASDDLALVGDDMGRVLASVPDQARMNERIKGWIAVPFPPPVSAVGSALGYVCAAAIGADTPYPDELVTQHLMRIVSGVLSVFPESPAESQTFAIEGSALFMTYPRDDDRVLVRVVEDHAALVATLPRDRAERALTLVNTLVQLAPLTPVRREIVTVMMAVLGLGRAAAWRKRELPKRR